MKKAENNNLKINSRGFSNEGREIKLDNSSFIVKKIRNPKIKELEINNKPEVGEEEINKEKYLSEQISVLINVKSSSMAYKELSSDENKFENKVFIPRDKDSVTVDVVVSIDYLVIESKEFL